jgi:prefoldin subunit 5
MNTATENNLKNLEERINEVIRLIDNLRQENSNLKAQISEIQQNNNQAVDKINFILDNISKML